MIAFVIFDCVFLGASSGTVELLPAPSSSANWTVGLPTDNGHDSDQVFEFNGTQAIKVPDGMVSTSLKEPFTISVWMRHGPGAHEKETILCNSDKTGNVPGEELSKIKLLVAPGPCQSFRPLV